jgi:hypothetical protein
MTRTLASALIVSLLAGCATIQPSPPAIVLLNCTTVTESARPACESDNLAAMNRQADAQIAVNQLNAAAVAQNAATTNAVAGAIFVGIAAALVGAYPPRYYAVPVRCGRHGCW